MAEAALKTPEEQVKDLESFARTGDLANMMRVIGDLHERWGMIRPDTQTEIKKMEAIFLTMLKARASAGAQK